MACPASLSVIQNHNITASLFVRSLNSWATRTFRSPASPDFANSDGVIDAYGWPSSGQNSQDTSDDVIEAIDSILSAAALLPQSYKHLLKR